MTVAIIDYGSGNLHSAAKAFERAARTMEQPEQILVTRDPDRVWRADRVVLPGVGAFRACRDALVAIPGMVEAMGEAVNQRGTPFLGVCVGMQLLYEASEETPGRAGLGILPGTVQRIPDGVKHPQMQWNVVDVVRPSPLFDGLDGEIWMYFVHSYAAPMSDLVTATCDYGGPVVASVQRDNVHAAQFHPEKSSTAGLRFVDNFVSLVRSTEVVA